MPSSEQRLPTSSVVVPRDSIVDESSQTLELAMKAADIIRKTLQQSDDHVESSLWVPPGTVPGLSAFVAAGLLFSPVRNAILTRANASRSFATTSVRTQTTTPSSETTPPSQSFQHFMDLIVTPAMAVIAAQIGLVVGTLYGSSHYLRQVVDYDNSQAYIMSSGEMDRRGKALDMNGHAKKNSICQNLLGLTDASSTKISGNVSKSQDDSVDLVPSTIEYFNAEGSGSIPNLYPSWDPRQSTIESLFKAIQHCKKHREGVS
jgi:hypothetical protein